MIYQDDYCVALFGPDKRMEIMNFIDRGKFAVVLRPDTDERLNIIPSRFVLAIKRKDVIEGSAAKGRRRAG